MKKLIVSCFCVLASSVVLVAQPNDNPYRTRYNPNIIHWTDSLPWSNITVATNVGITPDDNQDDSASIHAAIETIYQAGGGVLFFPAGVYNINGNLKLKKGVLLRGETPTGIADAHTMGYNPTTKFVFPRYIFDTTANNGQGTNNNTAFKGIINDYDCSNFGLVNIDINRAFISFQPEWNMNPTGFFSPQPIQKNRNIIVFGVRSNNAAIPDPAIPVAQQRPWQRYCWRFTANIDISAMANVVVANCRANGEPNLDETFNQPNYIYNQRNTSNWIKNPVDAPVGYRTRFDYTEHYGISVNRKKKRFDPNTGKYEVMGALTYATPQTEPTLFATGIEILDNYVWHSSRVAYMGAGIGLVMKGNISRMDPTKQTVEQRLVAPTGRVSMQGSTTLENRGLDFSGWDCLIENNDIQVFRDKIDNYLTTDGEGILVQECCGGTSVNDYKIIGNTTNGAYIGIYKMRDLFNVSVKENNLNGGPIWIWANTNGGTFYLSGTEVLNNTNVSAISMNGDKGGVACIVDSNTSDIPGRTISAPCHVKVLDGNLGFNVPHIINNNGGLTCEDTEGYPLLKIISPSSDTSFVQAPTSITVKIKLLGGFPNTNTMTLFVNGEATISGLTFSAIDSIATTVLNLPNVPANSSYTLSLVAHTTQSATTNLPSVSVMSSPIRISKVVPTSTGNWSINQLQPLSVYPNPTFNETNIKGLEVGNKQIQLIDLQGKIVLQKNINTIETIIDLDNVPAGIYLLRAIHENGVQLAKIIKQ